LAAKRWIEQTGAIGLVPKVGRYGETCKKIERWNVSAVAPEFHGESKEGNKRGNAVDMGQQAELL